MSLHTCLRIQCLELNVHLGCTNEERVYSQKVHLSLDLFFSQPPQARTTDLLKDTVCYSEISQCIMTSTQGIEFQTIEYLAFHCMHYLKLFLKNTTQDASRLKLNLHKLHPPIEALKNGVSFEIEDIL